MNIGRGQRVVLGIEIDHSQLLVRVIIVRVILFFEWRHGFELHLAVAEILSNERAMRILKHIFHCEYLIDDFQQVLFIVFTVILKGSIGKGYSLSECGQDDLHAYYNIVKFIDFDYIIK